MERTCLILVAFTALAAFGVQAQEGRNTITEEWRCFALFDFSKETVAVDLTRKTPDGEAKGSRRGIGSRIYPQGALSNCRG